MSERTLWSNNSGLSLVTIHFWEWEKKEEEEGEEEDNKEEEKKRDGGREREGIRIYSFKKSI